MIIFSAQKDEILVEIANFLAKIFLKPYIPNNDTQFYISVDFFHGFRGKGGFESLKAM
jgi:hypothetical protein